MGIVFRQSVKTSIVVFGGALLGAIVILLSAKFIPDKQEFGFTRNLTSWAVTLSQMLLFGLSSTLFVFTHRYVNDAAKRKVLIAICLIFPLILSLIATVCYIELKEWILHHFQPADAPLMRKYFLWLPLYTLLFLYMTILEQYLGSQMKVAVSAFMREILLRGLNIILIIFFAYGYVSFHTLVIGSILIYLVPVLIFLLIAAQTKSFGLSLKLSVFSRTEYKELASFSWYHFLLSISIMLIGSMDMVLIPFYDHNGFSSVAVYAVAVYLISFLQMPSKAFLPASFSILTKAFTENDHAKAKDIFIRSSLNLLIPTVGVAILLCCNLENAVSVIGTGKSYAGLIPVFLILFAGRMIDIATGMNDQVLSITNYYKFNFYVSMVVMVLLYVMLRFLIPRYGVAGAALSSTITLILFNICKLIFISRKLHMQPFTSKSLLVVVAGLPALAVGYFLPFFFDPARHVYVHTFIDVIYRSGCIIVVYILMLLWLKPSDDLVLYLAQIKKNKRLF